MPELAVTPPRDTTSGEFYHAGTSPNVKRCDSAPPSRHGSQALVSPPRFDPGTRTRPEPETDMMREGAFQPGRHASPCFWGVILGLGDITRGLILFCWIDETSVGVLRVLPSCGPGFGDSEGRDRRDGTGTDRSISET